MEVVIKISDILNSNRAVSSDNGNKIYFQIKKYIDQGKYVVLDFDKIELIITAFLNSALGQLYSTKSYSSDFLNTHVSFKNVKQRDIDLFRDVLETAKKYFADKEGFDKVSDSEFYGKN